MNEHGVNGNARARMWSRARDDTTIASLHQY